MKENAIVFCAGYYYQTYKSMIDEKYNILYICDNDEKKWGNDIDGIMCISFEESLQKRVDNYIIATTNIKVVDAISRQIENANEAKTIILLDQIIHSKIVLRNDECHTSFIDDLGNQICIEKDAKFCEISIDIWGKDNYIEIGSKVEVKDNLKIYLYGNGNRVTIKDSTTIVSAKIEVADGGKVLIGDDCMISRDVELIQKIAHPIFDISSGNRLNHAKDVVVGNHVWIGRDTRLLSGFSIGDNSIVGEKTVTSSVFGNNLVVAGVPGKVLRSDVMWMRDTFNLDAIKHISDSKYYKEKS